jgi:hypothetical protein
MSKQTKDEAFGKALEPWEAPAGAGEPLVCVATSFTFDATFFETECVGRFLQMQTHPSESESVGYLIEREEKLASARVCALVDRRHARDKESLRWDVIGVLVPRGIQHAKVALLIWGNRVRVIIGSGNLTEPGYRRNLEVFGLIEVSRTEGGDRAAVGQTIDFLEAVLGLGVGEDGPDTPRRRTADALAAARRHVSGWPQVDASKRTPVPAFGLPGRSAVNQLETLWPGEAPARTAYVVSPFFDKPPADGVALTGLLPLLAKRRPRELCFYVRADSQPDGRIRVFAPLGMLKLARQTSDVHVHHVLPEQKNELRDLHAKMIMLASEDWQMLLIGSSNFTGAGLTAPHGNGNCEANIVYRIKVSDPDFRLFESIWPETGTEFDLGSQNLVWDPIPEELEGGTDEVPLPACFKDAIFVPGKDPSLLIVLEPELPTVWSIREVGGEPLLDSVLGSDSGRHQFPWGSREVPFVLQVSWEQAKGTAAAKWPVNVSNPSALPPPDALRDLSLEELLEILASTRPPHDAVTKVLEKRARGKRLDVELDPLKRFDSQAFLLRRTKRVAAALERMRERLQRAAITRDAFEWRLSGAIGPMALADAFVRDAKIDGEAKFYLAELALALSRVKPEQPMPGEFATEAIKQMLDTAIREIQSKALALPSTPQTKMLDDYVSAAFVEAVTR